MEESVTYREKIMEIGFPQEIEEKLLKDTDKLMKMSPNSQDSAVIRNYLDTVLDLPWNKKSDSNINLEKPEKQLTRILTA